MTAPNLTQVYVSSPDRWSAELVRKKSGAYTSAPLRTLVNHTVASPRLAKSTGTWTAQVRPVLHLRGVECERSARGGLPTRYHEAAEAAPPVLTDPKVAQSDIEPRQL